MVEDIVKQLGYLTLGTRLKRLGERLQAQTQELLEEVEVSFPAAHFPLLAAIDRLGPLSVGELADAIGVSQPGITRLLERLETQGWVQSTHSADDRRVRTLVLTRQGRQLIARSRRMAWPLIEAAVAQACSGPPRDLLQQLAALEDALASTSLSTRARMIRREGSHDAA